MQVVEVVVGLRKESECVDCSLHRHENDLVDDVAEVGLAEKHVANRTDRQRQRVRQLEMNLKTKQNSNKR